MGEMKNEKTERSFIGRERDGSKSGLDSTSISSHCLSSPRFDNLKLAGEARGKFWKPSIAQDLDDTGPFSSSPLDSLYLAKISSDFKTDFCVGWLWLSHNE